MPVGNPTGNSGLIFEFTPNFSSGLILGFFGIFGFFLFDILSGFGVFDIFRFLALMALSQKKTQSPQALTPLASAGMALEMPTK
jgi:hypothetical protein